MAAATLLAKEGSVGIAASTKKVCLSLERVKACSALSVLVEQVKTKGDTIHTQYQRIIERLPIDNVDSNLNDDCKTELDKLKGAVQGALEAGTEKLKRLIVSTESVESVSIGGTSHLHSFTIVAASSSCCLVSGSFLLVRRVADCGGRAAAFRSSL